MSSNFKKFLFGLIILLALILAANYFSSFRQSKSNLEVDYLDVGQGDATLINYAKDYQVLIDGGPNGKKVLNEMGKVMSPLDRKIEVVVLTHPDQDHLAGLIDVAKSYEIGVVLDNGQQADTETFQQWEKVLQEKNIRREKILQGSKISMGDQVELTAFNPADMTGAKDDRNDASVVLRLDYGKNSFLFAGDAEDQEEQKILQDEENVDVDWLKVAHHGSKYASATEFLQKVTPAHAIISVGKDNRYHHPAPEVIERLNSVGAQILRTDEKGTIKIECQKFTTACVGPQ